MYVDDSTHIPGLPSILFSITYNMQNWRRKGWECLSHEWHQGLPIGKQKEVGISMVQTILGSVVSVQMLESWIVRGISGRGVNRKFCIVNTVFPQSFCFCGTTIWEQRLFRWKARRYQLLLDRVRYVQVIQWWLLDAVSKVVSEASQSCWNKLYNKNSHGTKTWVPLPLPSFPPRLKVEYQVIVYAASFVL